ncbi:MAG TPA: hypothetical protein VEC36_12475 [Patescibacteria group bacterium]|nr:hypothetical protein [Patescibacteria group bacterium]
MKKIAIILGALLCAVCVHTTALAQADILLTGTITDEATGKGISVKYEIIDPSGKKVLGKSNSVGGAYQAILKAGQEYTINISAFDIMRKSERFSVPGSAKYMEHPQSFTVKKLSTGTNLFTLQAFSASQSAVLPAVQSELTELREILKQNRLLKVVLTVGAAETNFPKTTVTTQQKQKPKAPAKKGKKASEPVAEEVAPAPSVPTVTPEQELVNRRIAALKEYFADVKNAEDRIQYVCELPDAKTVKTKSGAIANLVINVGEVKDMFD